MTISSLGVGWSHGPRRIPVVLHVMSFSVGLQPGKSLRAPFVYSHGGGAAKKHTITTVHVSVVTGTLTLSSNIFPADQ